MVIIMTRVGETRSAKNEMNYMILRFDFLLVALRWLNTIKSLNMPAIQVFATPYLESKSTFYPIN